MQLLHADVAVIPNFLAIERFGGDFSQSFPNLHKYANTVKVSFPVSMAGL